MSNFYKGQVIDNNDPAGHGRIRVLMSEFASNRNVSPFMWPIVPYAGNMYGVSFIPEVGDEVVVVRMADGDYAYVGSFWTSRNPHPSGDAPQRKSIITKAGHKIILDDAGDVIIEHENNSSVRISADGDIEINTDGVIKLAGDSSSAVLAEALSSVLNSMASTFGSHTHASNGAPTSSSMTVGDFKSGKVKLS